MDEGVRFYFEEKMYEYGYEISLKRNKKGDYVDKLTALMYLSFVEGVKMATKVFVMKEK